MLETINPHDLFEHLIVFGATGCGKTRHVVLPLLARMLAMDSGDPDRRAGALVFDVKGDMDAHLHSVMKAAGREDDIIKIGRLGNAGIDPLAGIENDSRAVAERLIEMVRGLHPGSGGAANDDFWRENNRRLLQVASICARAIGYGDLGGVEGVAKALRMICDFRRDCEQDDEPKLGEVIGTAERFKMLTAADADMARSYLEAEIRGLASSTWSCILNYARTYISCLTDSRVAGIFSRGHGRQFVPEDILDHGRVVLVSLSRVHFGPAAQVYSAMVKTAFQECALQRHSRSHFDGQTVRPINRIRPVYFVGDEFPSFLTPGSADDGDAFFLDKCREVSVGCILSAQSVSAITSRMLLPSRTRHLLNNCRSKIFMSTDCAETLEYFDASLSREESGQVLRNRVPAPAAYRLPNYEFAPAARWEEKTQTDTGPSKPRFLPAVLRELNSGEGILLRPQGAAARVAFPAFLPPP